MKFEDIPAIPEQIRTKLQQDAKAEQREHKIVVTPPGGSRDEWTWSEPES